MGLQVNSGRYVACSGHCEVYSGDCGVYSVDCEVHSGDGVSSEICSGGCEA